LGLGFCGTTLFSSQSTDLATIRKRIFLLFLPSLFFFSKITFSPQFLVIEQKKQLLQKIRGQLELMAFQNQQTTTTTTTTTTNNIPNVGACFSLSFLVETIRDNKDLLRTMFQNARSQFPKGEINIKSISQFNPGLFILTR